MAKLIIWTPEQAKAELSSRLAYAKQVRRSEEQQWQINERTLFSNGQAGTDASVSFEAQNELNVENVQDGGIDVSINYAFKNYRFIHSQLSANPPSVVIRPTSNDPSDRRKADAADRLVRFAIRQYKMQEMFDITTAFCLTYGTAFVKTSWDADKGDIIDVADDGTLTMEGDHSIQPISPWRIYLDPDAALWDEVKYVFEEIFMPYEEALFRFPGKKEQIEKYRIKKAGTESTRQSAQTTGSSLEHHKYDVVRVYQYWEKGLPYNGMIGRFCWCGDDGAPLTDLGPNPFRFSAPRNRGIEGLDGAGDTRELPTKASLPYHNFTDIDMPGQVWGRSFVFYEAPLQDIYNRMTNVQLDVLQAHGIPRMVLPEGTEVADDSITNSAWDIVKITGNQPPFFIQPMPMPNTFPTAMAQIKQGIDDMAGVNESMFGQQQREQSGFSMQYATNQGNMIRRRLFNKYVLLTESVYRAFLQVSRKYWTDTRTIYVLGKEKAFEALDLSGADLDGGFDLVVEYGASLSLDPTTRREEILTLMPVFEKAGVETRTILQMLKLNEIEGLYDEVQLAEDRQREIFEEMIAKNTYIPPRELADHKNMLSYASRYVMTSDYKYLTSDHQKLVDRHITERLQKQSAAMSGAAPQGVGAAGPAAAAQIPNPPEMGGQIADATQMGPTAGNPGMGPVA